MSDLLDYSVSKYFKPTLAYTRPPKANTDSGSLPTARRFSALTALSLTQTASSRDSSSHFIGGNRAPERVSQEQSQGASLRGTNAAGRERDKAGARAASHATGYLPAAP